MWNLLSNSPTLDSLGAGLPWQGYFLWTLDTKPNIEKWIQPTNSVGIIPKEFQPEALFLDVDATTIEEESLTPLAQYISQEASAEINALTEKAMSGTQEFSGLLRTRMECFSGLPIHYTQKVSEKLTLTPGIQELTTYFHDLKKPVFLISGGFSHIIRPIAEKLGATDIACNHFKVEQDKIFGVLEPILDTKGKKIALETFCHEYQINPSGVVAVGDGANDIEMLQTAALAAGFRPKKILWPELDVYDGHGNHNFLKTLLGTP